MLVNVEFKVFNPSNEWMMAFEESGYSPNFPSDDAWSLNTEFEAETGVYYCGDNCHNYLKDHGIEIIDQYEVFRQWQDIEFDKRPNHDEFMVSNLGGLYSEYGVCDNHKQILEKYPFLEDNDKKYFITLDEIVKEEQPSDGGWRWHKWGEYIGELEPQCEYLYDEPEIERVYCYHIWLIK